MGVPVELIVVGAVALVTAVISALAGLGGGIILLGVIAQFHPPIIAIPIHGAIQFVSNGSRGVLLRRDINWSAVAHGSLLVLPAVFLGVAVATSIPEAATQIAMGGFILIATWRPSLLRWDRPGRTERSLIPVGALSGFLSATVGASGPVASPFYRAVTVSHQAFVATAATTQILSHAAKLLGFGVDGFDFVEHADTMAVGIVGVLAGTRIGTKLLGRANERDLAILFKVTLTALALRLIAQAAF